MAHDAYSKWLGLPPGKRPPKAHELLGLPANPTNAAQIDEAAGRRMDQLDQFALSNDRATRQQVQQLMNEVAKARTRLVARIPKPKPETPPTVESVPTPQQQAPKPATPAPMPAATSASAATRATAPAPLPAPVSAPAPASAKPSTLSTRRPAIVFWSLFAIFWAGSLAAVYAVTFAVATPEPNEPTSEPAVVSAVEPSTEPEPATAPAPAPKPPAPVQRPQPPAPQPVAQLPSITDPRFKKFMTNWRQDAQSKKWDLNVYATYEHEDDKAHVVGVRQNMLLLGVSGLDSYRPHFWSDPKRRDDPQGGNWERYDRLEQSRPFTDRFILGFTHIPEPVAEITDLSAKFHVRIATNISHTDIPLDQHGRWLELAPGIRGKIDLSANGDTSTAPDTLGLRTSQSHRATVYYEDSYMKAGPTFIEAYAIYEDGTKGKSIYGRGGGSQGDVRFRFLGFMGGQGQRLNAIRFYYADGWKEQEVQLKVDKLPTPSPAAKEAAVEQTEKDRIAREQASIEKKRREDQAEQQRLEAQRLAEAERIQQALARQFGEQYLGLRDQLQGQKKLQFIVEALSYHNGRIPINATGSYDGDQLVGLDLSADYQTQARLNKGNAMLTDLSPLAGLKLRKLNLERCKSLSTLDGIQGMPLEWLNLKYCSGLLDISAIKGMPIQWLTMSDLKIPDLEPLRGMPLKYLWCMTCHNITTTAPLEGIAIETIKLNACTKLADITGLESLNAADGEVSLYNTPITDLSPLKGQKIGILNLGSCDELVTLDGLEGAEIGQLDLRNLDKLKDLSALPKIRVTDRFYLSHKLINNVRYLRGLKAKSVSISCPNVQRLDGLEDLPNLEYLDLQHMNHLTREEVQRIRSRYDDLGGFDPRSHRE